MHLHSNKPLVPICLLLAILVLLTDRWTLPPAHAVTGPCDVNSDGAVDMDDISMIMGSAGSQIPRFDINKDGRVTSADAFACMALCDLPSCAKGSNAPANLPPFIASTPLTQATAGMTYRYLIKAFDPEGNTLTYSLGAAPQGMAIDQLGQVVWAPATPGVYGVIINVSDGELSGSQSFAITVSPAPINNAPQFISVPPVAATTGALYTYQAVAADPDKDQIYYLLTQAPSGMGINSLTGLVTWAPQTSQVGTYPVSLLASDRVNNVSQNFNITVTAPPKVQPPAKSCDINGDGVINTTDITVIYSAIGTQLLQYDIDNNGKVTSQDGDICFKKCTNPNCMP